MELTILDKSPAALSFCRNAFVDLVKDERLRLVEGDFTKALSVDVLSDFDVLLLKDVLTVLPTRESRVALVRRMVSGHLKVGGFVVMAVEDPRKYDATVQAGQLRGTFHPVSEAELRGLGGEVKEAVEETPWFLKESAEGGGWTVEVEPVMRGGEKDKHIVVVVSCRRRR